ncbi:MAG: hypothetical protein LUC99_05700 [Clostridiales bacterium]|nr:hypothetical protein [Clostridiales bacterium]
MNDVISPIHFLDYDKISDTLLYFSRTISLRFNVRLASKNRDGRRKPYHVEYRYPTEQYSNVGEVISLKRDFRFYFSIEDADDLKNGVMITPQDVTILKLRIENSILPWFIDGKRNIFGENPDNGKLIITGQWEPQYMIFKDYKYLEFMPIVLEDENGKTDRGIRMCMNSTGNFTDMSLYTFMEFYYYIANTDMYSVAANMLVYVKMQPYGTNLVNVPR